MSPSGFWELMERQRRGGGGGRAELSNRPAADRFTVRTSTANNCHPNTIPVPNKPRYERDHIYLFLCARSSFPFPWKPTLSTYFFYPPQRRVFSVFLFFFCRLGWYSLLDRFNEQPLKASLGGFSPWKRWTASDWYSVPLCCCEGGWYNGRREARCCRRICSSSPSVTTWREQMWGFFLIFFVFLRNILS